MKRIQPHSLGLVSAAFLAIVRAFWSLLVAAGWAQQAIDFIFRLHMIAPAYRIAEFHLGTAAGLVAMTAAIGYIAGWVMGLVWNRCIPRDNAT